MYYTRNKVNILITCNIIMGTMSQYLLSTRPNAPTQPEWSRDGGPWWPLGHQRRVWRRKLPLRVLGSHIKIHTCKMSADIDSRSTEMCACVLCWRCRARNCPITKSVVMGHHKQSSRDFPCSLWRHDSATMTSHHCDVTNNSQGVTITTIWDEWSLQQRGSHRLVLAGSEHG